MPNLASNDRPDLRAEVTGERNSIYFCLVLAIALSIPRAHRSKRQPSLLFTMVSSLSLIHMSTLISPTFFSIASSEIQRWENAQPH
jgi:hypothetical protein